jgi:ATP-dependent helicase/nuclease subunit B
MASARANVYTIPSHRAFADALASGLLAGGDVARTLLLLPNRRAQRTITEAFVRLSGGGLLLPRMLPIGDVGEDEALGLFDEAMAAETDVPPAIGAFARRMLLMNSVADWHRHSGRPVSAVETLRLADALARVLDQVQLEGVAAAALATAGDELGRHWGLTREFLSILIDDWPLVLARRGQIDRAARRQLLLAAIARCWRDTSPRRRIVAAGMATADPTVAALLAVIARLPDGFVVLPGLDLVTDDWDALGDHPMHPQASLRNLLDRMGVARAEVLDWPWHAGREGPEVRGLLLNASMALPASTAKWPAAPRLDGLVAVEAANPSEESLVIALAMRRQLEVAGSTAALVTPDRGLARRVRAQLGRWGIDIDDSAGTPLARTPPGTFLIAALDAATRQFAPVALLALLKHPLAGPGDDAGRRVWLDHARALDGLLRGVRPPPGLAGITRRIPADNKPMRAWWRLVRQRLAPLERMLRSPVALPDAAERLRTFAGAFGGDRVWRGAAGRAAGELLGTLAEDGGFARPVAPSEFAALFAELAAGVAVRPAFGKHPRLAIYGLLEARLQFADLMILGGLNEGVWPADSAFDPWLPPSIRREIGLPDTERSIGLAAHDFVSAASAPAVVITRARRDASAPTVPSRFWLRLQAFCGGALPQDADLLAAARAIDRRSAVDAAERPAPVPSVEARPRQISVTEVERLRADPFSFYARRILGLDVLDPLEADPTAADKGSLIHRVIERLIETGRLGDARARREVLREEIAALADHPLLDALWRPRVERMLDWTAEEFRRRAADGWTETFAERKGSLDIGGVRLTGKADVVQRRGTELAIGDFKTGAPPSYAQIEAGYALQLGLLAALAEAGVLAGIAPATAADLVYWRLSGGETNVGRVFPSARTPRHPWPDIGAFRDACLARFNDVVATYLIGGAPFRSKEAPEFALHLHDYDHLARVDEWQGRGR